MVPVPIRVIRRSLEVSITSQVDEVTSELWIAVFEANGVQEEGALSIGDLIGYRLAIPGFQPFYLSMSLAAPRGMLSRCQHAPVSE
jgi:hypothetical protein